MVDPIGSKRLTENGAPTPEQLDELDELLVSPAFFDDPHPTYRLLRERDPVHWCVPWGVWVVTSHAEVDEVLMSPDRFSSAGWETRFMAQLPDEVRREVPALERFYATQDLSRTDPPAHRRLRTMVVKSFTPRVLEAMRPRIERLVAEMLDRLEDRDECELIAEFAYPMPAIVIAQLLGASEDECDRYSEWSHALVSFIGTGTPDAERARRADAALTAFREHLTGLVAEVRAHPRDDLLSHLAGEHDGFLLTDEELITTCVTILLAGHETTANVIGNGLLTLLQKPDQLQLLRSHPEEMPAAVEELLRFEGAVQRLRRVARSDTELGGVVIPEGDLVMAFVGAANRDPAVFADPGSFDVRRKAPHLTFGHGVHFCVGAGLSRIEAPVALNEILRRWPDLGLASDRIDWRPNITFRGLERLPLRLR